MTAKARIFALILISFLAFALRFHQMTKNELWIDEAHVVLVSSEKSPGGILEYIRSDTGAPAYFLLLHGWIKAFGDSVASSRMFSLAAALAAIPFIYLIGRECFSPGVGVVAALLYAVNPVNVYYGQNARPYTLLIFFVAGALYCVLRWFRERRTGWLAGYAVFAGLSLYTHNIAFFLLFVPFVYLMISGERGFFFGLSAATLCVLAAYLPWAFVLFGQLGQAGETQQWLPEFYRLHGIDERMLALHSFEALGPGGQCFYYQPFLPYIPGPSRFLANALTALLFALGLAAAIIKSRLQRPKTALMPFVFIAVGIAFLCAGSCAARIYVLGRSDLPVYVMLAVALSAGAFALRPAALRVVAACGLALTVALSLVSLRSYYRSAPVQKESRIAEHIMTNTPGRGIVMFVGYFYSTAIRYRLKQSGRFDFYIYPREMEMHQGWRDLGYRAAFARYSFPQNFLQKTLFLSVERNIKAAVEDLARGMDKGTYLWVVYDTDTVRNILKPGLKGFSAVGQRGGFRENITLVGYVKE